MKKSLLFFLFACLLFLLSPYKALAGKCYGFKNCRACTTCGYCKWCNAPGQTQFCGVYHGNGTFQQRQLKVKAKLLPAQ